MLAETDEMIEYHIYVEHVCLVTTHALADALVDVICTYFIFDISYPKPMYPLLILLQHFVFGFVDHQKVPTSVVALCSSLV